MLTIFACPKPFTDPHIAIIQRNAITSWTLLQPKPEIILFGNEEGVAEICQELGLRHVPEVARNEYGTPLLNDIFEKAQQLATHDILCYVNADIILMSDFIETVKYVSRWTYRFLMVGCRYNVDIVKEIKWGELKETDIKEAVLKHGTKGYHTGIDYFVFPKFLFEKMPPFAIGRLWWDHWIIWKAREAHIPVVDASSAVIAIHQNHDYGHLPGGEQQLWQGKEMQRNYELTGNGKYCRTLLDCTHEVTGNGRIRRVWFRKYIFIVRKILWEIFINQTYPIRRRLGLYRKKKKNKIW